ncbi:hypothetical protein niasHT_016811 [Heterodera trifolii]|uniref:BTB domain-containing protein n=1 Tax=Heterodera trifolii TaxID=157864 RepID=A0ABD2KZ09_9BILA
MPSSMDRMRHLLSTGEHSDVHFLVLPAHQFILKIASDVFEAMFHFDAKKERPENVSGNCPAEVEIPDIEPSAFKVMLSFIYTDDLSALNGDNTMAVLYAAKKYNIPDLVLPSLQISISELRNVFFAYAQALLFELEDFSFKCLRYICQNAAQLFGSDDFLQIDQKMLCNLLESDRLLLSDEFEIWNAAIRWADEKCRQNGIECSSGKRRSVLGPALFKIRFPNIHEEIFAKCVVPSGVLTEKEVLGVYQFNAHPFLYLHGIPGLYSLKFPSHGRIFDWNKAKGNRRGTIALEIEKGSEFAVESVGSRRLSDAVEIKGLALKIRARITESDCIDDKKCLGFYLWCDAKEGGPSNRVFSATYRIELMEPSNGFYNREEDKVTLAIDFTVKDEKIEKFVADPNKSNGTLSMEIEKLSEFAREIKGSERKSEAFRITGMPWKISAEIEMEYENNEKWLGFYLLCDASEKDEHWSRKCSATLRIVSQKNGTEDLIGRLNNLIFDKKSTGWGFSNFIRFAELLDPSKGFYNREEDKMELAIDFIMDETKMEKIISDPNKSNGTLSMEIEELSAFAREIGGSERISETAVYIKGMTWKISAEIVMDDVKSNEKRLCFSLLSDDAPKEDENWSCNCSGTFQIVSQKNGVSNFISEFDDDVFDYNENKWAYLYSISFAELMDPEKSFYDQSEDKVTLAIEFTVNEAKPEDKS